VGARPASADENDPGGMSATTQRLFGAMVFGFGSAVDSHVHLRGHHAQLQLVQRSPVM
jgi:hypothetical protein